MRIQYFSLFLVLIVGTSCSTQKNVSQPFESVPSMEREQPTYGMEVGNGELVERKEENKEISDTEERIVLYNVRMEMLIKKPDSTNKEIALIAEKYDGYILHLGPRRSEIRVKQDQLNPAMNDLANLGKLESKRVSGQDVTDAYVDNEIRRDNALKARKRYLELLAKAENVEEALMVERELERLNQLLDYYEGNLQRFDHLSEYATIEIYLNEKRKLGIIGYVFKGVYKGVKWLFVRD